MVASPVLLWTLYRLRRRLRRDGLRAAIEEATPAERRLLPGAADRSEWDQRMQACYEDDIVSWWLLALRVRSICLYECLVLMDRLSRLPYVETVELVVSVHRLPKERDARSKGLDGHSWLVVNGKVFRRHDATPPGAVIVYRQLRKL